MNDIAVREVEMSFQNKAGEAIEAIEMRDQLLGLKEVAKLLQAAIAAEKDDDAHKCTECNRAFGLSIEDKVNLSCKITKVMMDGIDKKFSIKKDDMRHVDDIKVRLLRTLALGQRLMPVEAVRNEFIEGLEEIWSTL